LKTYIWDNEKLILFDNNLKNMNSTQILFFWINIIVNTKSWIDNFIKKYNVNNNYKNEIRDKFELFINELNILF
jgi:hypothetical protein